MKRIAIFPGSFDPFTIGHQNVVERGSKMFDELIIAVGVNSEKKRTFSIESTLKGISSTFNLYENVKVLPYQGLTSAFAESVNADFILRGIRNNKDFEYESNIAQINRSLSKNLETVFLITDPALSFISSSNIRELLRFNVDVSQYLPYKL